MTFTPENVESLKFNDSTFAPIDLLDYIYAVLHSPTYRKTYKEFLKIDFPRVPYPQRDTFWQLVKLGGQLRQLHLLEFEMDDVEALNVEALKFNASTFDTLGVSNIKIP